jgi:two-component system cell cycle sensor histidine kinase/response regulator CckA
MEEDEASGVDASVSQRAKAACVKRTVLFVEDDPMIRLPVVTALKRQGRTVVATADGREALAEFEAQRDYIGVAVLDLVMPRKDGLATFNDLRAIAPDLPVILTSGLTDDERIARMLALGAREFLPKPYAVDELARALDRALAAVSEQK